jgi:hypothetical protein
MPYEPHFKRVKLLVGIEMMMDIISGFITISATLYLDADCGVAQNGAPFGARRGCAGDRAQQGGL